MWKFCRSCCSVQEEEVTKHSLKLEGEGEIDNQKTLAEWMMQKLTNLRKIHSVWFYIGKKLIFFVHSNDRNVQLCIITTIVYSAYNK